MAGISVYFTDEESDWVERAAQRLGVTRSYVVRLLVRQTCGLPLGGQGTSEYVELLKTPSTHKFHLTGARQ